MSAVKDEILSEYKPEEPLDDITWSDGMGVEDLAIWGIAPIMQFCMLLEDDERANPPLLSIAINEKAKAMARAIYRILDEIGYPGNTKLE